jgi:hypothetical protein
LHLYRVKVSKFNADVENIINANPALGEELDTIHGTAISTVQEDVPLSEILEARSEARAAAETDNIRPLLYHGFNPPVHHVLGCSYFYCNGLLRPDRPAYVTDHPHRLKGYPYGLDGTAPYRWSELLATDGFFREDGDVNDDFLDRLPFGRTEAQELRFQALQQQDR